MKAATDAFNAFLGNNNSRADTYFETANNYFLEAAEIEIEPVITLDQRIHTTSLIWGSAASSTAQAEIFETIMATWYGSPATATPTWTLIPTATPTTVNLSRSNLCDPQDMRIVRYWADSFGALAALPNPTSEDLNRAYGQIEPYPHPPCLRAVRQNLINALIYYNEFLSAPDRVRRNTYKTLMQNSTDLAIRAIRDAFIE